MQNCACLPGHSRRPSFEACFLFFLLLPPTSHRPCSWRRAHPPLHDPCSSPVAPHGDPGCTTLRPRGRPVLPDALSRKRCRSGEPSGAVRTRAVPHTRSRGGGMPRSIRGTMQEGEGGPGSRSGSPPSWAAPQGSLTGRRSRGRAGGALEGQRGGAPLVPPPRRGEPRRGFSRARRRV